MGAKPLMHTLLVWVIFLVFFILNAGVRNAVITPRYGEHTGHIVSTITGIIAILVGTFIFIRVTNTAYTRTALILIGVIWVVLTIAFEFTFGHFVMKQPWSRLLADYNILKGRIWVLIPLTEFISPTLISHIIGKR